MMLLPPDLQCTAPVVGDVNAIIFIQSTFSRVRRGDFILHDQDTRFTCTVLGRHQSRGQSIVIVVEDENCILVDHRSELFKLDFVTENDYRSRAKSESS